MTALGRGKAPRVAVLAKRTSYATFVVQGGEPRVAKLMAAGDPTVRRIRRSHEDHLETQSEVRAALAELGAKAEFYEGSRSRIEGPYDLVVTVGGDGTVLGASHQLGADVPLLGVNSAPASSVGFFCAARKGAVLPTLVAALAGKLRGVVLSRMRVELNDRLVHNRVLNEALFCHASPAATSRYILRVVRPGSVREEEQKSSGLWVGPAAGSTAAQRSAGGRVLPLTSRKLQFVVREPYHGEGDGVGGRGVRASRRLFLGLIDEGAHLEVWSKMRSARLFLDGHHDEHEIGIGDRLLLRRSDETLTILGLARATGGPKNAAFRRQRVASGGT
ncbi:MAG: NAD(+)/NADH kinase [Polyangiaceae bacterium]